MHDNDLTPDARMRLNRAEYARRMNRVLDHIGRHLEGPLELAELADVANFSRFHFHRVFTAWMGETVAEYARRVRLERAAHLLARGGETVLEIALATGFGSGEAFARAFKQQFGCTPTQWRDATPRRVAAQLAHWKSNPGQAYRNPDQDCGGALGEDGGSQTTLREHAMNVQIETLPPATIAYQRKIGPYGPDVTAFWGDRMAPWIQSHDLAANTCYGIAHDDPDVTPAAKCRYDAAVEVPQGYQPGPQVNLGQLPGGRYAVANFRGKPDTIAAAWGWLMREWLPASGWQCDDRPCFERFTLATVFDGASGELACDICIPVRAL